MMKNEMLRKIEQREIVVGVVGLGYVGLPLAVEKAKAGFKTIGFDVQAQKVEMVNAGHNYIGDVVDSDLAAIVKSGMLSAKAEVCCLRQQTSALSRMLISWQSVYRPHWMNTSSRTLAMFAPPPKQYRNI